MNTPHIPWYKNYILLLIIFIPFATVCGSMLTIYLAVKSKESPILEDYYKVGLSPQKRFATVTDITAVINLEKGTVTVNRTPVSIEPLTLNMQHASKAALDKQAILHASAPNTYPLPKMLLGIIPGATWYFYLSPADGSWRIQGKHLAPKHGSPAPAHEKNIVLKYD